MLSPAAHYNNTFKTQLSNITKIILISLLVIAKGKKLT
jgi:hypothetical protein